MKEDLVDHDKDFIDQNDFLLFSKFSKENGKPVPPLFHPRKHFPYYWSMKEGESSPMLVSLRVIDLASDIR